MKKKVVMKLSLPDGKKRSKALKTAVGMPGVMSASLEGDRITVIGDGIDATELATMLRKRVGYAEIVTVTTGDEKKESTGDVKKEAEGGTKSVEPVIWQHHLNTAQHYYVVREYDPSCNIM